MEEARQYTALMLRLLAMAGLIAGLALPAPVHAANHHAGYYYPAPEKIEQYRARTRTIPNVDRKRRIGFVTAMVNQDLSRAYAPEYAMFAKGTSAEKLIIVSVRPNQLNTIYRVRALLAMLTSVARTLPALRELGIEEHLTFFDLLKMLGFKQIAVSDGESFTHQVKLR